MNFYLLTKEGKKVKERLGYTLSSLIFCINKERKEIRVVCKIRLYLVEVW